MAVVDTLYEEIQAAVSGYQPNRGLYNVQGRCGGEGAGDEAGRMMDLPHQAVKGSVHLEQAKAYKILVVY